jgi:hypothetical protein
MHYGHPDVFDRVFHITRGGISKASRVINISEDIFAGITLFFDQEAIVLVLFHLCCHCDISHLTLVMCKSNHFRDLLNYYKGEVLS